MQLTHLPSLCSAFQPTSCVVSILWSPVIPHSVARPSATSHSEPRPKAPWVPALSHVLGPTVDDWLSHHHWPLVALHVVGEASVSPSLWSMNAMHLSVNKQMVVLFPFALIWFAVVFPLLGFFPTFFRLARTCGETQWELFVRRKWHVACMVETGVNIGWPPCSELFHTWVWRNSLVEDFLSEETCIILLQGYVVTPLKAQILLLICPAELISIIFLFPALSFFSLHWHYRLWGPHQINFKVSVEGKWKSKYF